MGAQLRHRMAGAVLALLAAGLAAAGPPQVGRKATPAEVAAWDIDVRADFKGLPKGYGSVRAGEQVWESRCASCHGTFGESNHMFPPLVGGTTAADIASGHAASLAKGDVAQRSTIMKLAHVSTLWDYINRAMPWNAPKTLTTDEVYAVCAYILNLADVVPADYVLSDANMADVQQRLPNRRGLTRFDDLWQTRGKGDVRNSACMHDCAAQVLVTSFLPDSARNAHGNLAEQNRLVGSTRGTDTARAPAAAVKPGAPAALANNGCTGCHAMSARLVGPGLAEVMARYQGKPGLEAYFAGKIRAGSSGAWGALPMPSQGQVREDDLKAIAAWLAAGSK
jgi:cytochrome c551/c552